MSFDFGAPHRSGSPPPECLPEHLPKFPIPLQLPMPSQYFSSDSDNELRLHKLGEIRWIYLSLEPSKAWPMLQEYLKNDNDLSISKSNPKTGEILYIPKKYKARFRASKRLKELINKQ